MDSTLVAVRWEPTAGLIIQIAPLVVLAAVVCGVALFLLRGRILRRFHIVSVSFPLPGGSTVEVRPNEDDLQIAHRIWTELVTRKAALPLDPEHDIIVEVYDSWYALFGRIRELIADIPARLVRDEKSTRELVHIATSTLNDGLRPHLTEWQARYRNWYANQTEQLKTRTPQQVQREYPDYARLVGDMTKVNRQLIAYAEALKRAVDGQ